MQKRGQNKLKKVLRKRPFKRYPFGESRILVRSFTTGGGGEGERERREEGEAPVQQQRLGQLGWGKKVAQEAAKQ